MKKIKIIVIFTLALFIVHNSIAMKNQTPSKITKPFFSSWLFTTPITQIYLTLGKIYRGDTYILPILSGLSTLTGWTLNRFVLGSLATDPSVKRAILKNRIVFYGGATGLLLLYKDLQRNPYNIPSHQQLKKQFDVKD